MDEIEYEISEEEAKLIAEAMALDSSTKSSDKCQKHFQSKVFSTVALFSKHKSHSGTSSYLLEIPANFRTKKIAELTLTLEKSINDSISLPIPYLESNLYEISREYFTKFQKCKPIFGILGTMHPISKILEIDDVNNVKWALILEQYLAYNENAFAEYKFLKNFILFMNDLCMAWDIANVFNYQTRFAQELQYIPILDLDAIFKGIINPEILWLTVASNSYPMNEILNEEVKELAKLTQSLFLKAFNSFLRANQEFILKNSSIRPWISYKNPNLHKEFAFPKPEKTEKPRYQELKKGFFHKIINTKVRKLRQRLEEFEFAYRTFENSLLLSLIAITES